MHRDQGGSDANHRHERAARHRRDRRPWGVLSHDSVYRPRHRLLTRAIEGVIHRPALAALAVPAGSCDNPAMDSSVIKAVGFVHLHVHSAYSLREGALTVEMLAKLAQADAMPALAITDTNNLFGALEFSEKLVKSGVQPIIGAQMTVDFADAAPAFWRGVERDNARAPIVLLAQSETGYGHLM